MFLSFCQAQVAVNLKYNYVGGEKMATSRIKVSLLSREEIEKRYLGPNSPLKGTRMSILAKDAIKRDYSFARVDQEGINGHGLLRNPYRIDDACGALTAFLGYPALDIWAIDLSEENTIYLAYKRTYSFYSSVLHG